MQNKFVKELVPSLILALGIVAAQAVQVAWSDLAATSVLAVLVLFADASNVRLHGGRLRPSPGAWILASTFVVVGALALLREPGHTGSLLPILGLGAWVVFFMPGRSGHLSQRGTPCSRF